MAPDPTTVPIGVLARVRGVRWREVGSAENYLEALVVAEAANVPGSVWWFRTASELGQDITPGL